MAVVRYFCQAPAQSRAICGRVGAVSPRTAPLAARIRAARCYADLKQPQLAQKTGLGYETIKRIEAGRRTPSLDERQTIADACGVPRWFIEEGFGREPAGSLDERVATLEREVSSLRAAAGLPAPPGELGRRAAEPEPTGEDQQPGRRPGEGGRSGGGDG
jgi:transcriptional regulator with XRE-family HTH domain